MKKYVIIGLLICGICFVLINTRWNMLQEDSELRQHEFDNVSRFMLEEYNVSVEEIPEYESVLEGPFNRFPRYRFHMENEAIFYYPFPSDKELNRAMKTLSIEEQGYCFVFQKGVFHYRGDTQSIKDFLLSIS